MYRITERDARIALEAVARREGKAVDEIRGEIALALNQADCSKASVLRPPWKKLLPGGSAPEPEEVIADIANYLCGKRTVS